MDALIGISGFIGSNIAMRFGTITPITRTDLQENHRKYDVDILYIAAPSADKWKIASNPENDLANIRTLSFQIKNSIRAQKVVLFSTVDVYKNISDSTEESDVLSSYSYGGNRFIFESEIRAAFSNVRVCRLGGLFGPNLRKNLLYDLKNRRLEQLSAINPNSRFQYLPIGRVLDYSFSSDTPVLNVVGPPIVASEIAGADSRYFSEERIVVNYNIRSKYSESGYFYSKSDILNEIRAFTVGENA